ncbi:hypothetical protein NA56DRAFT_703603 [Hyaloscypha hepaticicola]|uniref:Uncharacterized protein n=1 Tax=Hyaloscypha hepaticicola TaxID=2082293 RepID=A0A2J6Q5A4_9HELO|nr:hypothetical protein NA56DRAFT_703603 [Hyaloscypha hepaticicola]
MSNHNQAAPSSGMTNPRGSEPGTQTSQETELRQSTSIIRLFTEIAQPLLGFVIVQAQDIIDDQEWQDDEIYEDMYWLQSRSERYLGGASRRDQETESSQVNKGRLHIEANTKARPQVSIISARGNQRAANRWRGFPRRCRCQSCASGVHPTQDGIFDDSWSKEADVSNNLLDENRVRRGIKTNTALGIDLWKERKAAADTAEE